MAKISELWDGDARNRVKIRLPDWDSCDYFVPKFWDDIHPEACVGRQYPREGGFGSRTDFWLDDGGNWELYQEPKTEPKLVPWYRPKMYHRLNNDYYYGLLVWYRTKEEFLLDNPDARVIVWEEELAPELVKKD